MAIHEKRIKILAIYENGAGGHRAAALAISEALKEIPNVDAPTLELDTLAPKARKKMYTTFMDLRPHFGPIVRVGFRFGLRPNPLLGVYRAVGDVLQPWSLRRFLDIAEAERPDLIVTTHFRPNVACSGWLKSGKLRVPVHSVCPDFLVHGLYPRERIGKYYVASEAAKCDLVTHGIAPERVMVTGLPVSLAMSRKDDRPMEEIRTSMALRPDLPMILVMGGARGDQDYEGILRAMDKRGLPMQAVVLCGWNKVLKEKVEGITAQLKIPVYVMGFQSNMADWYRAADVILTKAGSMTPAECMSMGKAMVVSGAHPGKEEMQGRRLAEAGAFLLEPSPLKAVDTALRLMADPTARQRLEASASAFQPGNSARLIAQALVEAVRGAPAHAPAP